MWEMMPDKKREGNGWASSLPLTSNECFWFNDTPKITALKKFKFRSKFKLTAKDRDYKATKGLETIKDHACQFINFRIAPAFPKNDGKQTPMKGHPVFIAQHATGTCCRRCLEKWYRIEKGRLLSNDEIKFVVKLVVGWILEQDGQR